METINFLEKINELTASENLLAVGRDVNELRTKFEDYLLETERQIQVAQLETQDNPEAHDLTVLKARLDELAMLKDNFYSIYGAFKEKRKSIIEERNAVESKNLSEKRALIARLKETITTEENIGAAFGALKDIQNKWKAVGDIPRDNRNDIQSEYSRLLEDFFYNIKIYADLKDYDFQRNFQLKKELINELKQLNTVDTIREVESSLKKLQNDWNDIGPVPNEEWDSLKESYWTEVRSIYDKINRFYDDRRAILQANIEQKQALLEATRLIVENKDKNDSANSWENMTKEILSCQANWKKIGFGPKKENEEVWKEFRAVCDEFFDAKKAFFAEIHGKLAVLADKKKALIAKANELKDSTDWKETANKLKQLQQQWKMIGHSGAKTEQKLWKSFRSSCDTFFNARTAFFENKDKENEANLIAKTTLITAIKAYKPSKDKNTAIADLKKFSTDFNAIGHVPMKSKDTIFNAFKTAMDEKYAALKMEGAEMESILFQAKIETIKASSNASRQFADLKMALRKQIDVEVKKIALLENNLGFFANSKGADALRKDVDKKIAKATEKITVIKSQLKLIPNE
ncbi:MAG: DUF349 domain-containing protein [Crocinitomicaceae bacterium]|nr:DUF349 domain-containing protein [Crocinitomicaceae bacterium]